MAKWTEIQKQGVEVRFVDGTPFAVGQQVSMGLGSIELRNTQKAGLHVVRLSGSGHFKYSLKLSRDGNYRLGPDRGHRVVTPSEEADPIKRTLREMEIPVSNLVRATEPSLQIGERWYDNGHCPNGRPTNRWITDGRKTEVNSETREQPHGYFGGGGYNNSVIEGASYAVCVDSGRYMNGCGWTRPGQIVVWSHCTPTALASALASILYGDGADAEYLDALKDCVAASNWIAERYSYCPEESAFSYGQDLPEVLHFQQKVGYGKFSVKLDNEGNYIEAPVSHLFRKFGVAVLEGLYETKKAEFKHLFEDVAAAEAFITGRFDLRRTPTGIGWSETPEYRNRDMRFQVAEKGSDRWAGPSYGLHLSGESGSSYPKIVEVLLRKHGDELKRRLFDQAPPSKGYWGRVE